MLDSDDAADFALELQKGRKPRRWQKVCAALEAIRDNEYIERDDGARAFVSAEMIVAARGARTDLHEELGDWAIRNRPDNLGQLSDLAIRAIDRVMEMDSELRELYEEGGAGEWERLLKEAEMLRNGLKLPLAPIPTHPTPKIKRIRVKPGDVFEIPLPNGQFGYGRFYDNRNFYIYQEITNEPSKPPIGSRKFLFYGFGLRQAIAGGEVKIVGVDSFGPHESSAEPAYYSGDSRGCQITHGSKIANGVPREDCAGLERATCYYTLDSLAERIVRGTSTDVAYRTDERLWVPRRSPW